MMIAWHANKNIHCTRFWTKNKKKTLPKHKTPNLTAYPQLRNYFTDTSGPLDTLNSTVRARLYSDKALRKLSPKLKISVSRRQNQLNQKKKNPHHNSNNTAKWW